MNYSLRLTYESFRKDSPLKGYLFLIGVGVLGAVAGMAFALAQHVSPVLFIIYILGGWILGIIATALGIWSYPKN